MTRTSILRMGVVLLGLALTSIRVQTQAPPVFPRFAYVVNRGDDTISAYTVTATGDLRHNGYARTGVRPSAVVAHPSSTFVYVGNSGGNNISRFAVGAQGTLGPAAVFSTGGTRLEALAVDSQGLFLYAVGFASNNIASFAINQLTGNLTALPSPPTLVDGPVAIAIAGADQYAYVVNRRSNTILPLKRNSTTGALGFLGSAVPVGASPTALAIDRNSRFVYVANEAGNTVSALRILPDGRLATIGTFAAGTTPKSLAIEGQGRFLYVASFGTNTVVGFSIAADGRLVNIGEVPTPTGPVSVTAEPTGNYLYVGNQSSNSVTAFRITAGTGQLQEVTTNSTRKSPAALAVTTGSQINYVPEFTFTASRSNTNNGVTSFSVDPISGAHTFVATMPNQFSTEALATHPALRLIYVGDGANVSVYRVESAGILTLLQTQNVPAFVSRLQVDPSGRFLYVVGNTLSATSAHSIAVYRLTSSGTVLSEVEVKTFGSFGPFTLALDPTGRFAYATRLNGTTCCRELLTFAIDVATGKLTQIDTDALAFQTSNTNFPRAVAVDARGRFVYVGRFNIAAYRIDALTGTPTFVVDSPSGVATGAGELVADTTGDFMFAGGGMGRVGPVISYRIDPASGALTIVTAQDGSATRMALDVSGRFIAATYNVDSYLDVHSVNAGGGQLTFVQRVTDHLVQPFGVTTLGKIESPVGETSLAPTDLTLAVHELQTLSLTWIHPQRWRLLDTIDLRIVDEEDPESAILWVRFDEPSGTLRRINPRNGRIGQPKLPGDSTSLETNTVTLFLAESIVEGSGPTGPTVTLHYALSFKPRARGRSFVVEAAAVDDGGTPHGFETVGRVTVTRRDRDHR